MYYIMVLRMKSWNECPKCGFEGLMIFKSPFKATDKKIYLSRM